MLLSLEEMTAKMLPVRRNLDFLSAAEMFKKQCLSALKVLFPRMQMNLSWGTVFSTCKGSCKPGQRCNHPSFSEHLAYLEVSPTPPNPHGLISLSNTSMQLEANGFSQLPQQQTYGFSYLQSLWGTPGALCMAVIPTPVLSTAPSRWECYLWSFLNFLWGLTPLFWHTNHTLKISSITAVFTNSVYNLHRCFSLKQLS